MKIYIASSWKNEIHCLKLQLLLMKAGYEVDCFCNDRNGRYVFSFDKLPNIGDHDGITIMNTEEVQRAFEEDRKWIDWADIVVLLLPCGKSAHLEAGYAKGQGKKLYIIGDFPKGEFDVMYGFANGLYRNVNDLMDELARQDAELKVKDGYMSKEDYPARQP